MKKLMLATAIVCAAVVSQAGTFKWGTSADIMMPTTLANITVGENQAKGSGSTKGISKWLPSGDKAGATFVATIMITDKDAGKSEKSTLGVGGPTEIPMTYATNKANVPGIENSLFKEPSSGTTHLTYEIIITGTYVKGDTTYTITSSPIVGDKDLDPGDAMQLTTGVPASWTITATSAAPEPTSGLLLLLGVAGLALRRKQK